MADRLVFSDPEGLELELVIGDGEDEPLIAAAAERVGAAVPAASEPALANPDRQDRRMTTQTTDSGR